MRYISNSNIGGMDVHHLIKDYGSPLYVYEKAIIEERTKKLLDSLSYPKKKIYFACKSNNNIAIIKSLYQFGIGIDATSRYEVEIALKAGLSPEDILFTGDNSTDEEYQYCIENNVLVNCGSLMQLKRFGELNPGGKVSIRINLNIGAGHHDHVITGGPKSKFGIYFNRMDGVLELIKEYNLQLLGIHTHVGSGVLDANIFSEVLDALLEVAVEEQEIFKGLEFVDIGGGLGIPYKPEESPLNIAHFGKQISEVFASFCNKYGKSLTLCIEPGRYLVAESGTLLCTVNNIKSTPAFKFIGTDSGFNHLIRPMAYGSYHHIVNFSNLTGPVEKVAVAGNLCESGDVFTQNDEGITTINIREARVGDILGIQDAGAYAYSMASNYNLRPRPPEVMIDKGNPILIRRRETFEDMIQTQMG